LNQQTNSTNQPTSQITNYLTIDVEDYYQVAAFDNIVKLSDWDSYESRVVQNTTKILTILDEHNIKATFFILGWVAEKNPDLVLNIGLLVITTVAWLVWFVFTVLVFILRILLSL